MLDGLAWLMVLHGLLKVARAQKNPGMVGGAWPDTPPPFDTRSEEITFVKGLEFLSAVPPKVAFVWSE